MAILQICLANCTPAKTFVPSTITFMAVINKEINS